MGTVYPKIHSFQYNILPGKLLVENYKIIHNLGVLIEPCFFHQRLWRKVYAVDTGNMFCGKAVLKSRQNVENFLKKYGNMGKK